MIYIEVKGLEKVRKTLTGYTRKIPKASRRGIYLFTNHLAAALRAEAKAKGHNTTGYLSSPKGTRAVKLDKNSWAIKMPYYTEYLERGTPKHWIPRMYKTQLWARKHGMTFSYMRSHIGAFGTDPHPFTASVINREVKALKPTVEKQINDVIKKAG